MRKPAYGALLIERGSGLLIRNLNMSACSLPKLWPRSEAVAPVLSEQKYGYVNKYGKSVIDPQFEYVRHFSEGTAMVSDGSKWFFVQVAVSIMWISRP